jgi:hypothetical protein
VLYDFGDEDVMLARITTGTQASKDQLCRERDARKIRNAVNLPEALDNVEQWSKRLNAKDCLEKKA